MAALLLWRNGKGRFQVLLQRSCQCILWFAWKSYCYDRVLFYNFCFIWYLHNQFTKGVERVTKYDVIIILPFNYFGRRSVLLPQCRIGLRYYLY